MKCKECGTELKKDSKFCSNCGNSLEEKKIETKKKKNNHIIIFIVIGIILCVGIGLAIWFFVNNNSSNNNENNVENRDSTDDGNDDDPVVEDEIAFGEYNLTIPEGFSLFQNGNYRYIQNNEYMIVFVNYPLSCDQIILNKDLLLSELQKQGYEVENLNIKSEESKKYLIAKGKINSIEYGFVFYDIDENHHMFITMVSNYLGKFKEEWYDTALNFIRSAKKLGE